MKKYIFICLILFGAVAYWGGARAQSFSDVEIKAAYIMKLAKFVTWNGRHLNHINFCYIDSTRDDDTSVGANFQRLVRAKGAGNGWSVRKLRGMNGIEQCNMLFIADTEEGSISSILSRVNKQDILTMSDARRFIYKDGMLGFVLDDENRVKMVANLKNIRKTRVMISATVLELMEEVVK